MNNDSKKKKIIRFICFVILCALIFTGLNWLFTIKSQINNKVTLENIVADNRTLYKEQDHSLDVIAMGSSHAFTSFNPLQMFEEQGFTSLTMAGPFVKIDTAEYLLSEALKTQSPKALVLEVGALQDNGTDYDNFQLEAIINLRPSIEKYNFVQKLYPDDSAMRATAFLPIVGFHVRWVELTPEDFTYLFYRDYMHGFVPVFVKRPGIESQFDISEGKPLVQKEVENLRHLA
ncbi:MAG: hypothetical protein HUJ75_05555, partial [Parasporobacterium sp.]|nr:hypothetical protein [Parasporobacterium sp.]